MSQDIKKIGIIGGGAAGLFAACLFKKFSGDGICDVTLLEKNEVPGKKLILTGHGRCNITNRKPASELKNGYHEADNFIYPVCDSAARVRNLLVSYIAGSTKTVCNSKVLDIRKDSSFEVSTADEKYNFDYMILCCGGSSFPQTGSAGDSYRLAGKTGHTVITPRAALAPVKADEESLSFIKNLSGVSVASRVSLFCNGKKTASTEGEVLFAKFGLTGPAVMEISREIHRRSS